MANCYVYFFVTGGCEKEIFDVGDHEKVIPEFGAI